MYKHSAESIIESPEKRFVSQADKDKYDGYIDRFREKNDIYTKEELQDIEKELNEVKEVNSGCVASIEDTIDGHIKVLEVQGKTVQSSEVINIVPKMVDGIISYETGEFVEGVFTGEGTTLTLIATKRYIPVKRGDELRYFNNDKSRAVHVHFYNNDGVHLISKHLDVDKSFIVPGNATHVRLHQYKNDHEDLRLEITRPRYDIMTSVGDKREDGRYDINLVSCGANIINCPSVIEREVKFPGKSFATKLLAVKIEPNTDYTISGLYTKNQPKYNGGISIVLSEKELADTDRWFLTSEANGECRVIVFSEDSEKDLTKVFNSQKYRYLTVYLGVATGNEHSHVAKIENLMLAKGNKLLPYEEYKEDTCTIISDIPLEGLDGYSDKLLNKNGKWVIEKNIQKVIVDGTWDWAIEPFTPNDQYTKFVNYHTGYAAADICISTKYPFAPTDGDYINCRFRHDLGRFVIVTDEASTVDEFKLLLAREPVTVLYVSKTPEYIEIPDEQQIILNSFVGGTTVRTGNCVPGYIKIEASKTIQSAVNFSVENILDLNNEVKKVVNLENVANSVIDSNNAVYVENTHSGLVDNVSINGRTLINIGTVTDVKQLSSAGYATSADLTKSIITPGKFKWVKKPSTGTTFYPKIILDANSYGTIIPGKKYTIKYKIKSSRNIQQGFAITNNDAYVVHTMKTYDYDIIRHNINTMAKMYEVNVCLEAIKPIGETSKTLAIGFGEIRDSDVEEWVEIHDLLIVEGDHTKGGLSYFEGMKSVEGDLTFKSINPSKNLCKWSGTTIAKAGQAGADRRMIPFKPISDKFTIKFFYKGERIATDRIAYRLKDRFGKSLIIRSDSLNDFITLNATKINFPQFGVNYRDVEYLELFWNNLLTEDVIIDELVALDGHVSDYDSLTYTDQQSEDKPLMYLDTDGQWKYPILRGVSDTIKDTIEKHSDGKYYYHKRCEEVVLDGSEPWQKHTNIEDTEEYYFFITHMSDVQIRFPDHEVYGISKKFTGVSRTLLPTAFGNAICINSGNTGYYYYGIKILKSLLSDNTAEALKTYLSKNPLTVVRLHEEQVFECSPIDLPTYDNGTIVHLENSVIYPNINFKVNNNIGGVVNTLKDKISVLESDLFEHSINQNRILLNSLYCADSTDLKIDIAAFSDKSAISQHEDIEILSLIYKNITVGKENYIRDKMEEIIDFYTMIGKISFESAGQLFDIISSQHDFMIEE